MLVMPFSDFTGVSNPTKEKKTSLDIAREEADALMAEPNTKTYDSPRDLWRELGLL